MKQRRILIVRVGAMGDVLHSLPAVMALRKQSPLAIIDWVVDERWAPLLLGDGPPPVVSRVYLAATRLWSRTPVSTRTLASIRALRSAVRQEPYDDVVDLQGTLRSAVIGRMARSSGFHGFADPREPIARHLYTRSFPRRGVHIVQQNAALLGDALGVELSPLAPILPHAGSADGWATKIASRLGRPFALLAPTAGWRAKEWPIAHFAALARILGQRGWAVLVNAAHSDDPVPLAVCQQSGTSAEIVSSAIDGLLALTRHASLVVGGDTGPVHLAAALGVPTIALFGPTDPARNGPWGAGPMRVLRHGSSQTTYKRAAPEDPGLANLSVDEVLAAADEILPASARMV